MSRKTRNTPVLPGLSRSVACRRTKGCARLDGHKRACRATLARITAASAPTKSAPKVVLDQTVRGFRIVITDDGNVTSTPVATTKSSRATKQPQQAGTRKRNDSVATGVEKGVEVHSADRYTVQEPEARPTRRTSRPPMAKGRCRVVKAGTRCSRAYGHKATGTRHNFAGATTILPTVEPKGRDVQTVAVKHSRTRGYIESRQPSTRLA